MEFTRIAYRGEEKSAVSQTFGVTRWLKIYLTGNQSPLGNVSSSARQMTQNSRSVWEYRKLITFKTSLHNTSRLDDQIIFL